MRYLWIACLLLSACAPALTPTETTPVIPGATAHTQAFAGYTSYFETLGQGDPVLLVHGIGGGSSLYNKLDVYSCTEAAVWAREHGITDV